MLWTFIFDGKLMAVYLETIRLTNSELSDLDSRPPMKSLVYYNTSSSNREDKVMNMKAIEALLPNASRSTCKDFMIVTSETEKDEKGNKLLLFVCNYRLNDPGYQLKIWSLAWSIMRDYELELAKKSYVQTVNIGLYFAAALANNYYGSLARVLLFNNGMKSDELLFGTKVKIHHHSFDFDVSRDHNIQDVFDPYDKNVGILNAACDLIDIIMKQERMSKK